MGGMGSGFCFPVQLSVAHFPGILVSTAYRWGAASPGWWLPGPGMWDGGSVGASFSPFKVKVYLWGEEHHRAALNGKKIYSLFQLPLFWKILQIVLLTKLPDAVQLPGYLLGDWMKLGCPQGSGLSLTGHLGESSPGGGWSVMIPVFPLCAEQKGLGSAMRLDLLWHLLVTSLCPSLSREGLSIVSISNQQMFIKHLHWEPLCRCSERHPMVLTVTTY